jgi:hypothetical protein
MGNNNHITNVIFTSLGVLITPQNLSFPLLALCFKLIVFMVQIFLCLLVLHCPNYLQSFCRNPVTIANFLVSFELEILHSLRRIRKIAKSFITSVSPPLRPSVRPHGTTRLPPVGFSWLLIFEYFLKFCSENQAPLTPDKDNGYFTWRRKCIYGNICLGSSYNEKYYRQKVQKESKHTFVSNYVFLKFVPFMR